jgi:hypothetical protein
VPASTQASLRVVSRETFYAAKVIPFPIFNFYLYAGIRQMLFNSEFFILNSQFPAER